MSVTASTTQLATTTIMTSRLDPVRALNGATKGLRTDSLIR
jgi:hypothetical protein